MRRKMPAHGGDTIIFRRYNPLDTAMVPLGNTGITPRMSGRVKSSLIDLEALA